MDPRTPSSHGHPGTQDGLARPWVVAGIMLAVIALFFLLREHWDHIAGNWVYLLLLACPLMHVFMHGGHGHGGHHGSPSTPGDADRHAGGK